MEYVVKPFDKLSPDQLYTLLKLRQDVFALEQNCLYPDLDDLDRDATHVLGYLNGTLAAYLRILPAGKGKKNVSIGRVVVKPELRGKNLGKEIFNKGNETAIELFGRVTFEISAQAHLQKFYTDLGYSPIGEIYDEDGIPHIKMIRENNGN